VPNGRYAPRDGHPLLLAAGELAREAVLETAETDLGEQRAHPLAPLAQRRALEHEHVLRVLERGQHRDQVEALEDEAEAVAAEPAERHRAEPPQVLAVDLHAARRRAVEPADQVEERALSRARRPGHGGELPGRDHEVDATQRRHGDLAVAVDLGHPLEPHDGRHGAHARSVSASGTRAARRMGKRPRSTMAPKTRPPSQTSSRAVTRACTRVDMARPEMLIPSG